MDIDETVLARTHEILAGEFNLFRDSQQYENAMEKVRAQLEKRGLEFCPFTFDATMWVIFCDQENTHDAWMLALQEIEI